jgi:hypothetical protein
MKNRFLGATMRADHHKIARVPIGFIGIPEVESNHKSTSQVSLHSCIVPNLFSLPKQPEYTKGLHLLRLES